MEQLVFNSLDGLPVTADHYPAATARGLILLCHRSHFNRGEYREIAPRLNVLGYAALAIDQRSGMNVLGVVNETSTLAKQQQLPTGYLDARQDMEAALVYACRLHHNKPVILMGSSYSAALALMLGATHPQVKAVIAFSPGEYLRKTSVAGAVAGLKKPVFVTSARQEIPDTERLVAGVDPVCLTHFKPEVEGAHGARALWRKIKGSESYWLALEQFLDSLD
ncbi:MAG: alpha/beta hydrolase [Bacteroidetes bacterium]|nr:alpha/beta hydrolase [Bacteroidota bacterium]